MLLAPWWCAREAEGERTKQRGTKRRGGKTLPPFVLRGGVRNARERGVNLAVGYDRVLLSAFKKAEVEGEVEHEAVTSVERRRRTKNV